MLLCSVSHTFNSGQNTYHLVFIRSFHSRLCRLRQVWVLGSQKFGLEVSACLALKLSRKSVKRAGVVRTKQVALKTLVFDVSAYRKQVSHSSQILDDLRKSTAARWTEAPESEDWR